MPSWYKAVSLPMGLALALAALASGIAIRQTSAHHVFYISSDTYSPYGCGFSGKSEVKHDASGGTYGNGYTYTSACGAYLELYTRTHNSATGTYYYWYNNWVAAGQFYSTGVTIEWGGTVNVQEGLSHRISMTGPDASQALWTQALH